jgi:hypothetical protein
MAVPVGTTHAATTLQVGYNPLTIFYGNMVLDGELEVTSFVGAYGDSGSNPEDAGAGTYPTGKPGETNVLYFLQHVSGEATLRTLAGLGNGDIISDSTSLTMSYQPRYLYLAGA